MQIPFVFPACSKVTRPLSRRIRREALAAEVEEAVSVVCPEGAIPRPDATDACIFCPPGTAWVNGTTCAKCPINSYQDESGQLSCKPCPNARITTVPGVQFLWNCIRTLTFP